MKRFFHLPVIAVLTFSVTVNAQSDKVQPVKNNSADRPTRFVSGQTDTDHPPQAQKLFQVWKDFDNNTLDNSAPLFSNDVQAVIADEKVIQGREQLLQVLKEYRNSLGSVSSTFSAYTNIKANRSAEIEGVTIRGLQTATQKDGTVNHVKLNETWIFDKEGKIVRLHLVNGKGAEQKKIWELE